MKQTDDPGAKKCFVRRSTRRVEMVREHSKTSISVMWCGSASGDMQPPMVVYKALNLYDGWTTGGPQGTVYDCTPSGWFDGRTFTKWFLSAFLPAVEHLDGRKVLLGDNLASHFTVEVIRAAQVNNVYFCALPPNATNLMQPLDVSVFGPMKRQWRAVLGDWRTESRKKGCFPKQLFPALLQRLTIAIAPTLEQNLKSGFRSSGLYPVNRDEVLKKLPSAPVGGERAIGILNAGLIDLLQRNRGQGDEPQRKRGRKVVAGRQLREEVAGPSTATAVRATGAAAATATATATSSASVSTASVAPAPAGVDRLRPPSPLLQQVSTASVAPAPATTATSALTAARVPVLLCLWLPMPMAMVPNNLITMPWVWLRVRVRHDCRVSTMTVCGCLCL